MDHLDALIVRLSMRLASMEREVMRLTDENATLKSQLGEDKGTKKDGSGNRT